MPNENLQFVVLKTLQGSIDMIDKTFDHRPSTQTTGRSVNRLNDYPSNQLVKTVRFDNTNYECNNNY